MSRDERTGWRDQRLSERHRMYGDNCPMVDLDFPVIEYDSATPAALVEYKHLIARPVDPKHPTCQALRKLADAAEIPFLIVRYNPGRWTYQVQPFNVRASRMLFDETAMSEREYVEFLHEIRGREPNPVILRRLLDIKPKGGCL